jgi:DNA polymerase-3 subunit epsilon
MRQIILDTETTGLETSEGHRIIEIGAVELINRRLTGKHFHRYVNPERSIDDGALQVHGITSDFLKEKPVFAQIIDEFLAFIQGADLIIHNAKFDTGFINHEIMLLNQSHKIENICKIIDTLILARQLHPGQKNSLDALCKRYNVDNSKRELHGALMDAQLLAFVFLAMTGGQGSLFGEAHQQEENSPAIMITKQERAPLKIISATTDELALHETRLQEIQQLSKNMCIWLQ